MISSETTRENTNIYINLNVMVEDRFTLIIPKCYVYESVRYKERLCLCDYDAPPHRIMCLFQ